MLIENDSKLVMIGDSISDCGRAKPVGEGLFGAAGNGYINLVDAVLRAFHPEKNIRVVNMGTSGDTVRELKMRWQTDVFDLNPDWVSIYIGINDIWRQYDCPMMKETHVYIDEYRETLDQLVKKTKERVKGIVLITPHFMELNKNDAMRASIDEYGSVVKEISKKYDTVLVDAQAAFDEILKHCHPAALAWDRVHPNTAGHMVIARAFLNAIGMEWE